MPEKYHIETKVMPPRLPRTGKFGIVDWREDCAKCHNCVKKACVYDRYKQEMDYIKGLSDVDALFFDCMGCFFCVQNCTKGLLALSLNPEYERMGNGYFTPDIIMTTWNQAETAAIPVSGAGYRGKFSGTGFDAMWTDMSEIVRPTRDGIHGREYISTAVDIGRKPQSLLFEKGKSGIDIPPLVNIPMPLVIDMQSEQYYFPNLVPVFAEVAVRTGILAIIDWHDWELLGKDKKKWLQNIILYLDENTVLPPKEILQKTRLIEIGDTKNLEQRISEIKSINPGVVVTVRVVLDERGEQRAIDLAHHKEIEVIHLVADINGNQVGVTKPKFIMDMVRNIHTSLVKSGVRDEITIIAGGGIALAEHMAKQILCGADLVTTNVPLLISLECGLCKECRQGISCPARIDNISGDYGISRMTNLIAAWHDQLIEVMGAMGIRDVRRLRGEVGRALFFEDLEEDTFGRLFGKRNR